MSFACFANGWRHALRSEWPFIIMIITCRLDRRAPVDTWRTWAGGQSGRALAAQAVRLPPPPRTTRLRSLAYGASAEPPPAAAVLVCVAPACPCPCHAYAAGSWLATGDWRKGSGGAYLACRSGRTIAVTHAQHMCSQILLGYRVRHVLGFCVFAIGWRHAFQRE